MKEQHEVLLPGASDEIEARANLGRQWWMAWNRGAPFVEACNGVQTEGELGWLTADAAKAGWWDRDQTALILLEFLLRWRRVPGTLATSDVRVEPLLQDRSGLTPALVLRPNPEGIPLGNIPELLGEIESVLDLQPDGLGNDDTGQSGLHGALGRHLSRLRLELRPARPEDVRSEDSSHLCLARDERGRISLALETSGKRWWIRPNQYATTSVQTFPAPEATIEEHLGELRVVSDLHPDIRRTWHLIARTVAGEIAPRWRLWSTEALLAERVFDRQKVVRVELQPERPGQREADYRILEGEPHPIWGDLRTPSATGFLDVLQEEGENQAFLSGESDPGKGNDRDAVNVKGLSPDDNTVIRLEGRGHWPKTAWLKPNPIGVGVLRMRKQSNMNTAMTRRSTLQRLTGNNNITPPWSAIPLSGNARTVEGPPGTGKTWTACNEMVHLLQTNPAARILLLAKEHQALDHTLSSLQTHCDAAGIPARLMRVGGEEGTWQRPVWLTTMLEAFQKAAESDPVRDFFATGAEIPMGVSEAHVIATTATDALLEDLLGDGSIEGFDLVVIEEAGKATFTEMVPALALAPTVLAIGDTMQLPPYGHEEIARILARLADMPLPDRGNDYDEHLLRSIRKARGFDTSPESMDPDLLQPFAFLKAQGEGFHRLKQQRRMRPALADIVGPTFYGEPFEDYKEPNPDIRGPELLWIDCPSSLNDKTWREQRSPSGSLENPKEAHLVAEIVDKLVHEHPTGVTVITPYKGQVWQIQQALRRRKIKDVSVATTDAFQGREDDIIVLSLVRNNTQTTAVSRWGFLMRPERLNVALSRARERLVIVGCMDHIDQTDFPDDSRFLPAIADAFRAHKEVAQAWS